MRRCKKKTGRHGGSRCSTAARAPSRQRPLTLAQERYQNLGDSAINPQRGGRMPENVDAQITGPNDTLLRLIADTAPAMLATSMRARCAAASPTSTTHAISD